MGWRGLPSLTALRAFSALAEAGSTEAAGILLNVSHAAISQQIKGLEAHMGLALVDRSGRSLRLTDAGKELADALELGFGAIERVVADLTGRNAGRPLQITTTPTFASNWLLPRLPAFRAAHEEIELMMNVTPEVVRLEAGGVDLAIRYGEGDWAGLEAELLVASKVVIVAAPALVKGRGALSERDLAKMHWLVEPGKNEASEWLRRVGVAEGPEGGVTHLPGNMMIDAARSGQGVISTAACFVEDDIARGRLQLLFETDLPGEGYFLVSRPGVLRPVARDFASWAKREAKKGIFKI